MMLLLRCPQCRQTMKYENRTAEVIKKKKQCVYCGRSFTISRETIEKKIT